MTDDGATAQPAASVPAGPVRVVLVDDHRMFRSGVRAELGDAVEVVGEAEDADQAIAVIRETQPDVVLLDVHLPGGGWSRGAGRPDRPSCRTYASSPSRCPTPPRTSSR